MPTKETQKMNSTKISKFFNETMVEAISHNAQPSAEKNVGINKNIWDTRWMRLSYMVSKIKSIKRDETNFFYLNWNSLKQTAIYWNI